jgi:predicted dienelactone hydrolase
VRPTEIFLALPAAAAAIWLLLGPASFPRMARAALAVILVLALVLQLLRPGQHWQVYPLYLATAMLFAVLVWPAVAGGRLAGGMALLAIAAAVAASTVVPMFRLPAPTGPYAVGTRILHLVDASRPDDGAHAPSGHRELMVQVWYPAAPPDAGPDAAPDAPYEPYRRRLETTFGSSYQTRILTHSRHEAPVLDPATIVSSAGHAGLPLLIFNPAWEGQRTQSTFLMEDLASHGYIVAAVDHTGYGGPVAFPDGRVVRGYDIFPLFDFTSRSVDQEYQQGAPVVKTMAEDDSFVITELLAANADPASPFHGRIDPQRIGALGHSFGGATAVEVALEDARVKAAVNSSGSCYGELRHRPLEKPFLFLVEDEPLPDPKTLPAGPFRRYVEFTYEDAGHIHSSLAVRQGWELFLHGSSHWNFADRVLFSPFPRFSRAGSIDRLRAMAVIREATRTFFDAAFAGRPSPDYARMLGGRYPEVETIQFGTGKPTPPYP